MNVRRFIDNTVKFPASVAFTISLLAGSIVLAEANSASHILEKEWTRYATQFVASDGRVIDNANGNISHSEGQGYGMLIAYLAGQPDDFQRIWSFTQSELLVRDDGLAA